MKLQEKLNALKSGFESKAPKEALEIMHRATDDLRNSRILESALQVGDSIQAFSLSKAAGDSVRSDAVLAKNPMVLAFYRGKW